MDIKIGDIRCEVEGQSHEDVRWAVVTLCYKIEALESEISEIKREGK